jgi:hypothetical protein
VTMCCHMEAAVRKACVLQLSSAALADVCVMANNFMRNPARALQGGTSQLEIDLLARIAHDLVPSSPDLFMKAVDAQIIHMVACWPLCEDEVPHATSTASCPSCLPARDSALVPDAHTCSVLCCATRVLARLCVTDRQSQQAAKAAQTQARAATRHH